MPSPYAQSGHRIRFEWGQPAPSRYRPTSSQWWTSSRSPEAHAAAATYREVADQLPEALRDCASGQELIEYGFPADVEIAAELDQSTVVPVLRDGVFR